MIIIGGKMKIKVISIFMLAVVLLLAGCGKKDADIQKAAADKLTADKVTGVTVAVNDGVATLTGEVTDITVKSKAETSVKGVEGVKSVTNNITLKPLPTPPPPSPDKMLEGVVNESLKKKGITGVTVTAMNGEITLSGTVDKAKVPEVMMAANEANPKKVINNLNK
jgi:hyperosmotically inducible periplasmic protein